MKALSQKFIENAVETAKSERQSSYPRAGLILRTSSFKKEGGDTDAGVEKVETRKTVTKTASVTRGGESFLSNKTKVTGVQDVIERMSAQGRFCTQKKYGLQWIFFFVEVHEGETLEDAEARTLLNKFLGSQVLLSGMEARESHATGGTFVSKRVTKVTTTTTVSF